MKLSLTLFLAMALSMSPFAGRGPGCPSYLSWVCSCDQKVVPEEQHRVATKSQTSTRRGWFGLTSCPIRVEDKNNNETLSEEQPMEETKSQTSTWRCWLGLTSCPIRVEDKNKSEILPEEQPVEETKSQTSTWRCWFGLTSCPIRNKDVNTNQVLPEEQHTEKTKSQSSYWSCLLGSSQCPIWVWYKGSKVAVPQGPKQQSPGTKQKAYSLPGILGHLWDYLMQRGRTWLLTAPLTIFSILWLLTTARAHWRRLRRPRGQGAGQADPASLGTEETDNVNALDLLCQMDAYITLMERLMTILMQHHVKNVRSQQCRKTVHSTGDRKSPSTDS
ncbi:uncharacterized protein LOC121106537 [Gallus gallus]|uniref:uncharacterized protein LOC121106537 n=1 Tax=Gallus gallus TaxID=9031 RepID=UPI001AE583DE|nr:uncharacterized protein LOC121106537 [Gallus gallus]